MDGDGIEDELLLDDEDEDEDEEDDEDDEEGICGMLLDCDCWVVSQALSRRAKTLSPTIVLTRDLFMID